MSQPVARLGALFLALVLCVAAPHATPRVGNDAGDVDDCDDCEMLAIQHGYQSSQLDYWNNEASYHALVVSWDIQDGRGPGDPIFDHDVLECVRDGVFIGSWQNELAITEAAQHDYHCM